MNDRFAKEEKKKKGIKLPWQLSERDMTTI